MIRQIAPQFFSVDLPRTLAYYKDKLGFECLGTWQDPPAYAIVARDLRAIHFPCAEPPTPNPDKYADDLPLKPAAGVTSPHGCPGSPQRTWAEKDGRSPSTGFCPRPTH